MDEAGRWELSAEYTGNSNLLPSRLESPTTIEVVERPGYAVIVTGEISGREGHLQHTKTTNYVYDKLKELSFREEDIYYFNSVGSLATNATHKGSDFSKNQLKAILTGELKEKLSVSPAPVFLVLVNHGSSDIFHMGPSIADEISHKLIYLLLPPKQLSAEFQ